MKKSNYFLIALFCFAFFSCSSDDDPVGNIELRGDIYTIELALDDVLSEDIDTKSGNIGTPSSPYPFDYIYLASKGIGGTPLRFNKATVGDRGIITLYLKVNDAFTNVCIATSEANARSGTGYTLTFYEDVETDEHNITRNIITTGKILYFKSHPTTSVSYALSGGFYTNPHGEDVYQSGSFAIQLENNKLVVSGTEAFGYDSQENESFIRVQRLLGVIQPHLIFFYMETSTSENALGISTEMNDKTNPATWGYYFDEGIGSWSVMPYIKDVPVRLEFDGGNGGLSGKGNVALEDAFRGLTHGPPGDLPGLSSVYSIASSIKPLFNANFGNYNSKLQFEIRRGSMAPAYVSMNLSLTLSPNALVYYYVYVNVADMKNHFESRNSPLRSSVENEIPVSFVRWETKPLY